MVEGHDYPSRRTDLTLLILNLAQHSERNGLIASTVDSNFNFLIL